MNYALFFRRLCLLCLVPAALSAAGCMNRGYEITFEPQGAKAYQKTQDVTVFSYMDVDLEKIRQAFFADYVVIGKSSFSGPYNDPAGIMDFAREKGADLLITSAMLKEQRTHDMTYDMPIAPTVTALGDGKAQGAGAITTGTVSKQRVKMKVSVFDQQALFLRSTGKSAPLWKMNKAQFDLGAADQFLGCWRHGAVTVEIHQSGDRILGFLASTGPALPGWREGDLKFLLYQGGKNSGIYMMDDKTPQLARHQLDPARTLEVALPLTAERHPYERLLQCPGAK